jgi:hypothetical protein
VDAPPEEAFGDPVGAAIVAAWPLSRPAAASSAPGGRELPFAGENLPPGTSIRRSGSGTAGSKAGTDSAPSAMGVVGNAGAAAGPGGAMPALDRNAINAAKSAG